MNNNYFDNSTNVDIDIENSNFDDQGYYLEDLMIENGPIINKKNRPCNTSNNYIKKHIYNLKKSKSYPDNFNNNYLIKNDTTNHTINHIDNDSASTSILANDIELTSLIKNPLVTSEFDDNLDKNLKTINKTNLIKKIYFYLELNKIETSIITLNKFVSIFLHVLMMVIFEIYFYFNFVVSIEKKQFLNKIQQYIEQIEKSINLNTYQKTIIKKILMNNLNNVFITQLYNSYLDSLDNQKKLLKKLLIKSCVMAGVIGLILIFLIAMGFYKKIKINWNWILFENMLMFALLGIFEFWFFINVILKYNPITDDEIKYYVVDQFVTYYNSTNL